MAQLPTTFPTEGSGFIEMHDVRVYNNKRNAEAVGCLLYDLGLSRRSIIDELQSRLDYFVYAGGTIVDMMGKEIVIHEDYLEEVFGDDPGYKWLSDFPRKCKLHGLKQAPSKDLQKRLQRLHVALKAPEVKLDF
ncbi:hypothetical protein FDK21_18020 [Cohaesibacter sp. CAU 1516]|uniref:hypothetical protein n=1 Tax=Cohaesibacter sp. CAU 1516 TaxID=2576038 RepID=UPI0010FD91BB|nr:hypothetical protein [Cohaesibacter sp. CAU 1516]TLP43448.1 hypothetical protein FDK21_18020 [Cohaesibacter sp. CAU 1516]